MTRVRRPWAAMLAFAALGLLAGRLLAQDAGRVGPELLDRLPADVAGAFSFSNAAQWRQGPAGDAVGRWMTDLNALEGTRRAWGLLAERLDTDRGVAFDSLLGGQAVLALARKEPDAPLDWLVLAAVESALDVRIVRRTRAVPRKIVFGRAVLGLEEESFLLSTLPPMADGRSVLVLAPAGAEWLLARTLAVSAGRTPALGVGWLREMPADAMVRGFWKPQGEGGTLWPWLWPTPERAHTLAIWATVRDKQIEIGIGPMRPPEPPRNTPARPLLPPEADEGVLLDVAGPSSAIVSGILDRAGLAGLVPEDLRVGPQAGELIVRRGAGRGVELGARLAVTEDGYEPSQTQAPLPMTGRVNLRPLTETPAATTVFGPRPEMAWTLLDRRAGVRELVVAVTAGGRVPDAPDLETPGIEPAQGPALAIVLDAIVRAHPTPMGVRGMARPWALWALMQGPEQAAAEPQANVGGRGVVSLLALFESAGWHFEADPGPVRGRVVLDLR